MKILKLSSYFPPEQISSSHLTKDLNEAYLKAGFVFENYVPTPTRGVTKEVRNKYKKIKYEELENGKIIIHRFSMFKEGKNPIQRAVRYALVNFLQYKKGSRAQNVDLILSGSTPPTQGLLCGKVKKKLEKRYGHQVPFVYNLQDIFPDSLVNAKMTKKGSLIWKIGRKMEDYTYRSADKIIVISEDCKQNIMAKGVPEEKIEVIYNWIDTDEVRPIDFADNKLAEELKIIDGKFRVVYAGNLGMAQGVEVLIDAARLLQENENIEFLIFGKGVEEEKLKSKAAGLSNIRFLPFQPAERVSEVYSLGDCCVVMCKKGTGGAGVPSKTWSIMACARPLVVSFDESELCDIVKKADAGLCSDSGDAKALSDNILALSHNKQLAEAMGNNAREYAVRFAGKENATSKYVELIKKTV